MEADQALREEAHWFAKSMFGDRNADASDVRLRLTSYHPQSAPNTYLCPRCWMRDGAKSTMRPAPGTDEYDLLRCNDDRCGAEFVIPF